MSAVLVVWNWIFILYYIILSNIKNILITEIDFSDTQKLETAIAKSTVGISFDKAHPFLVKLKVENDKMLMNLSSSYASKQRRTETKLPPPNP